MAIPQSTRFKLPTLGSGTYLVVLSVWSGLGCFLQRSGLVEANEQMGSLESSLFWQAIPRYMGIASGPIALCKPCLS